eukprot:gene29438-35531_t
MCSTTQISLLALYGLAVLLGLVLSSEISGELVDPLNASYPWDCTRKWPTIGMVIPLFIPGRGSNYSTRHFWPADWLPEYQDIFLRSVIMYWPWKLSNTTLTIMCDEERRGSREFEEDVINVLEHYKNVFGDKFPQTYIKYNAPMQNVYRSGHDRQQYLTFTADYYTDAEYVAFMDSDAFVHTFVDREDLFENGKAIIQGRLSYENYAPWTMKTFDALGVEEYMSCMSYWPVLIKRAHLRELREAIAKHRQKETFEEAFWDFSWNMVGAQFNMMCTWLYLNKHDEYSWRLKDAHPEWNGFSHPRPPNGMWSDKSVFKRGELSPLTVPYLSQHISYVMQDGQLAVRDKSHTLMRKAIERILLISMCHIYTHNATFQLAPNATHLSKFLVHKYKDFCPDHLQQFPFHDEQLRFEMYDLGGAYPFNQKMAMQRARMNRLKTCEHTYLMM